MNTVKSIIIPPIYHENMIENSNNPYFQDFLLTSLFNDNLIMYKYIIENNEPNIINKINSTNDILFMPDEYLFDTINWLDNIFSKVYTLKHLSEEIVVYSLEEISTKRGSHNIYKRELEKEILIDNLQYYENIYNNRIQKLFTFLMSYRRRYNEIENDIISCFTNINALSEEVVSILFMMTNMYEEKNFDFDSEIFGTIQYLKGEYNFKTQKGKKFKNDILVIFRLVESYLLFNAAMNFSLIEGSTIKLPNLLERKNYNIINNSIEEDNYYNIYKIIIENIKFPIIDSFHEYEKIKKNKNIIEFKNLLDKWNNAIKHNEYKELDNLKKYLLKANEKFIYLDKLKNTSIDFYLAIPCAIIDLLFGTPISIIPTLITAYIKLDKKLIESKYKELMIK
jgi:hypothetical protein